MAGRPLKYQSVEEVEPLIEKYFQETKMEDWTITGLALALDTSRDILIDYEWRDEFSNTIKKAKEMVEHSYEVDLKKKGNTWTIFALKNFNWKDKHEVEQSWDLNLNVSLETLSDNELNKYLEN